MRPVLMVTTVGERGGAEVVMEALARRLEGLRYRPVLAVPGAGPLAARWRREGFTVAGLPALPRVRRLDRLVSVRAALRAAIRAHHVDLVYPHGVMASVLATGVARAAKLPVVWHAHDCFNPAWSLDGVLHRAASRGAVDRVVAVSETVAASLRGRVPASRITVIPNGVSPETVAPVAVASGPLIVWCGRLQHWKGAHVFLRVAQHVRARRPDARFAVVGDALFGLEREYAGQLRALAATLQLAEVTTFAGHVEDARPWLAAASVVVHCSLRPEPFGLVVAEAMMQARPVVAFRSGGPAEMLDESCGVLVPAGEDQALASAVVSLLDDPALASRLGASARGRALERFDEALMARRVEAVLSDVISRK